MHNSSWFLKILLAGVLLFLLVSCANKTPVENENLKTELTPTIIWRTGGEEVEPMGIDSVKVSIFSNEFQYFWNRTISYEDGELFFAELPYDPSLELHIQGIDTNGYPIYEGFLEVDGTREDPGIVIEVDLLPPFSPQSLKPIRTGNSAVRISWTQPSVNADFFEVEYFQRSEAGLQGLENLIPDYDTTMVGETEIALFAPYLSVRIRSHNEAGASAYSDFLEVSFNDLDATGPKIYTLSHDSPDTVANRVIHLYGTTLDENGISSFFINDSVVPVVDYIWEKQGILLAPGKNPIYLRAVDGSAGENETLDTLIIHYDPDYQVLANHPPRFLTGSDYLRGRLKSGQSYSRSLVARDPDAWDRLTYFFTGPFEMENDTLMEWVPALADTGIHFLSAIVQDQDGAADTLNWEIEVLDSRVNSPPEFETLPTQLTTKAFLGKEYADTLVGTDLDLDASLVFEVLEGKINIDPVSGIISWYPELEDIGAHLNTVRVLDSEGAAAVISWVIEVSHPNILNFSAGEDQIVSVNDTIHLVPKINLISGSILKYEWDIGNTGTFIQLSKPDTLIVAPAMPNPEMIHVLRITMSGGDIIQDELIVEVLRDNPQLIAGENQYVPAGENVTVRPRAWDEFGSIVKWEWDLGSTGEFEVGDSTIVFAMPDSTEEFIVLVRVTDDDGNETTSGISIFPIALPPFAELPGGEFNLGGISGPENEDAQGVAVTISPFKMDVTEISQEEYLDLMGTNPSGFAMGDEMPVENVTWFDAVLFCNARSKKYKLDTVYTFTAIVGTPGAGVTELANLKINYQAKGYRLPTEAEWEYAVKAGSDSLYFWGSSEEDASDFAVYSENSASKPLPSSSTQPNAYGLQDMAGNLWEWCSDWFAEELGFGGTDPRGPAEGLVRVIRGGSWKDNVQALKSTNRDFGSPSWKSNFVGFRTVLPQ